MNWLFRGESEPKYFQGGNHCIDYKHLEWYDSFRINDRKQTDNDNRI